MLPKVSVCIPAYNQVEFLQKTLESILIQTYQDYEVIVTDDSPDDRVQRLVEQFDFKGKLRYIKNIRSLGSPENWNEAVRQSKGEYIKIMHHDEWFNYNDSLNEFVSLLNSNPEADFAFSAATGFDISKNYKWYHSATNEQLTKLKQDPRCLFFGNFIGPPSATIYRKRANCSYDSRLKWIVDFDFYIRILLHNNKFVFSSRDLITSISGAVHNVTNECINNKCIELREYLYLYEKITDETDHILSKQYIYLLNKYNVQSAKEIVDCGYQGNIPPRIKKAIVMNNLRNIKSKLVNKTKSVVKEALLRNEPLHGSNTFRKASYSQSGEDLIVKYIFDAVGISKPSYLDIGAHHPFLFSNTALFYENGSRGINIEPDPQLFAEFTQHRTEDINLNIGISDKAEELDFYIMSAAYLNTFSREEAEKYACEQNIKINEVRKITVDTISSTLEKYNFGKYPDFLSLDVEGLDEQILFSMDFSQETPTVICVETISYSNKGDGKKNYAIIQFIESKGYMVYADTNINTIFVKKNKWLRN